MVLQRFGGREYRRCATIGVVWCVCRTEKSDYLSISYVGRNVLKVGRKLRQTWTEDLGSYIIQGMRIKPGD